MSDDIVTRLRNWHDQRDSWQTLTEAADEIERLRTMAKALYEETKRCGSKHDVKATNDWEEYEMEVLDAADEIERLRREVNVWRGICERFAESDPRFDAFRIYFKAVRGE